MEYVAELREIFRTVKYECPFRIDAMVVMPDHPIQYGRSRRETMTTRGRMRMVQVPLLAMVGRIIRRRMLQRELAPARMG